MFGFAATIIVLLPVVVGTGYYFQRMQKALVEHRKSRHFARSLRRGPRRIRFHRPASQYCHRKNHRCPHHFLSLNLSQSLCGSQHRICTITYK